MNTKIKFLNQFLIMLVCSTSMLHATEFGKRDGGEYYYRPGNAQTTKDTSVYTFQDDPSETQPSFFQGDMNFEEMRNLFPIFKNNMHGHPFIYFDSGSTAQMPSMVQDAIVDYYQNYKANVGRGLYDFAECSTHAFEAARAKVARFINATQQEIVFTSGATASINLVAHIWAKHNIHAGDEIVISEAEHNANFIPWVKIAQQCGALLKVVPLSDQGVVDIQTLQTYLSSKTKLVAITHQSNILGTTNDIESIVKEAHAVGAKVLIDAAQSVAHHKIDVAACDCDFLAFSGHKLFGPTGVGVCFIKKELFKECVLESFGGGAVLFVSYEHIDFKDFPHCLEPGTQPIAQVIGLGAAIDFVMQSINFQQAREHETKLALQLIQALQQMPGISFVSHIPSEGQCTNMVTFTCENFHAYDIAEHLNLYGIAVRAGFHCVQPYHDKLGGTSSVRVSFSVYNTEQEVSFLIECLKKLL